MNCLTDRGGGVLMRIFCNLTNLYAKIEAISFKIQRTTTYATMWYSFPFHKLYKMIDSFHVFRYDILSSQIISNPVPRIQIFAQIRLHFNTSGVFLKLDCNNPSYDTLHIYAFLCHFLRRIEWRYFCLLFLLKISSNFA